jgi:hypothetical protein
MFLAFQAAQELARYIGVESQFASWAIENMEGDMMQRDTITMLFNNLLEDSKKYNNEKEMIFVHTAFLTGSFVEKVHISSNLLKQKMNAETFTNKQEGNLRELLVIYLNQLDPATSILTEAFEKQQDQLQDLVILNTFEKLKELSLQLKEVKPDLAVAPISEIEANQDLLSTFELISELRSAIVTASG